MKSRKFLKNSYISLASNSAYALGNGLLGFLTHSWWFIAVGAYYAVLAATRFSVLRFLRNPEKEETEIFVKRTTGALLILLSFCLVGVNILAAVKDRGKVFHEIVMIAIAAYTFTKITMAIIGLVKAKNCSSPLKATLRNISFADAVVSVYSLQRSMLVSFPGMEEWEIRLMNILTGTAVWIVVLFLGINLIGGKHVNMAKSKIVNANKKIADTVTHGYKKIETGVVSGYKTIEKGVVSGYTKIEDKFVDAYLTKDGETVEEAKKRLKNKQ